jgi:PAS domain S-box-containing protein
METGSDGNAGIPTQVLRQSVAAAPCGFVVTDCQRKNNPIVFVNQAFERITGYKAGEVLGNNGRFLLGKDKQQGVLEQVRGAVEHGRQCTVVLRNYRKDGTLFYNQLSVAPIRNQSRDVTHFIWLQTDVTDRIKSEKNMAALIAEEEQRFSAYLENANEAIWRIDIEPPISLDAPESLQVQQIYDNGIFSEANDVVARIYGLTRGKEVIGSPLSKFMEQSDPKNLEKMIEFVRKRFHVNNLVTYEKDSSGTTKMLLNNIIPSIQENKVRHLWGTSLELSELFAVQRDLERSREELLVQKKALEEKNAALKELISHIGRDREELKDRIMANVEKVIVPSLEKFRRNNGTGAQIEQFRKALEDLTSSFGRKISDSRTKLTPREIEVCNMVKNGLTSKEIASLLNITLHTVEKHRRMARNKLELANKGINLRTYLNSL